MSFQQGFQQGFSKPIFVFLKKNKYGLTKPLLKPREH